MTSIRSGLAWNYGGRFIGFLILVVATPLQIRYLGISAYGVVGLALTLQSLVSLFDFGLGATVHRELARRSASACLGNRSAAVVRTLEWIYWTLAATVGAILVGVSPLLAKNWLVSTTPETLTWPIILASAAIAVHLPLGFYSAALTGLQQQATVNVLHVSANLLKYGGGVVVAALSNGSLPHFFAWTLFAAVVSIVAYRGILMTVLPGDSRLRLNQVDRRGLFRFSAGASAISIGLLLISQIDKLLVSRLVGVEEFAYYSLGGTVVGGLYLLYQPVVSTFAPRLAQAVGAGDAQQVSRLYHTGSQILNATVFPAAVVTAVFSPEVVFLWTRSADITESTAPIVTALMPGAIFGAAACMPFSLVRAAGWTSMPSLILVLTLVVLVPALSLTTGVYGPLGAATTWSIAVIVQSTVVAMLLHRRLLRGEFLKWLTADVGRPIAVSLLTCAAVRVVVPTPGSLLAMTGVVAFASAAALTAALLSTAVTREHLLTSAHKVSQWLATHRAVARTDEL